MLDKIAHDPLLEAAGGGGGYKKGYEAGYEAGHEDGWQQGYYDGEDDWRKKGYDEGYAAGRADGEEDGYEKGYAAGYEAGWNDGYDDGRSAGYSDEAKAYARYAELKPRDENGHTIPKATKPGEVYVMCRKVPGVSAGADFRIYCLLPYGTEQTIHVECGTMVDGAFKPTHFESDLTMVSLSTETQSIYGSFSIEWADPEGMAGKNYVVHVTGLTGNVAEIAPYGTDILDFDACLDRQFKPRLNDTVGASNIETARIRFVDGGAPNWRGGFSGGTWLGDLKACVIESDGTLGGSLAGAFLQQSNLEVVIIDAEKVTADTLQMCLQCRKLWYITPMDLSGQISTNGLYQAFLECEALRMFPVKALGSGSCHYAFAGSGIESARIDRITGATSCEAMFYLCDNLKRVHIGDMSGAITVQYMLYDCRSLEDLHIGTTPEISQSYFVRNDVALRRAYIGDCRYTTLASLFYGCSGLEEVYIPKAKPGLSTISIFYGCNALEHVYMPDYASLEIPERPDRNTVYQEGYRDGSNTGYADGYDNGYRTGKETATDSAYAKGHSDGYASGKVDGYDIGYAAGGAPDAHGDDYARMVYDAVKYELQPDLPTPTGDNEFYFTFKYSENGYDVAFESRSSMKISLEIGTMENGEFVPHASDEVSATKGSQSNSSYNVYASAITINVDERPESGYVVLRAVITTTGALTISTSHPSTSKRGIAIDMSCRIKTGTRFGSSAYYTASGGTGVSVHDYNTLSNLRRARIINANSYGEEMFNSGSSLRAVLFEDSAITTASQMFDGCGALIAVSGIDMSRVKIANYMFRDCKNLMHAGIRNVNGITGARDMFNGCSNLDFGSDAAGLVFESISGTSSYMFKGCSRMTVSPIIDFANCADSAYELFYGCANLVSADIRNTGKVTSMYEMFYGCEKLAKVPTLDMGKTTTITRIFSGCTSLKYAPGINAPEATAASEAFKGCTALERIGDIYVPVATSISEMFSGCTSLHGVPDIDAPAATSMSSLFSGCTGIEGTVTVRISNAATLASMFKGCEKIGRVTEINVPNATSLESMFEGCAALEDVGTTTADSATTVTRMFYGCNLLDTIGKIRIPNVTNVSYMFYNCKAIRSVDMETGEGKITTADYMFYYCSSLRSYGGIDTSKTTTMKYMFYYCSAMEHIEIDAPSVALTNSTTSNGLYCLTYYCSALRRLDIKNICDALTTTGTQYLPSVIHVGTATTRRNLRNLTITSHRDNWPGAAFSIAYNDFDEDGLRELFESLPAITSAKTITITGNPGADGIRQSILDIATAKKWTITGATNVVQDY